MHMHAFSQVQSLDLASLDSVRSFALSWQQKQRPLHMLINNAGIFTMGSAFAAPLTCRSKPLGVGGHGMHRAAG